MKKTKLLLLAALAASTLIGTPAQAAVDTTPPIVTMDVDDGTVIAPTAATVDAIRGTVVDSGSGAAGAVIVRYEVRAAAGEASAGSYNYEWVPTSCSDTTRTSCAWSTTGPYAPLALFKPVPGVYNVYATASDRAGNSTTVGPKLVVIL